MSTRSAVAVLTLPLVGLFSSPQYGFPIVIACLAFFGAIFAFLCFYNTKEIYSKPYEKNIGFPYWSQNWSDTVLKEG